MNAAHAISKRGFRRWYERELLQSHAHLVLLLLASIGLLGGAEAFSLEQPVNGRLTAIACVAASAGIGVWALRRYLYLLTHAEFVADQAVCRSCNVYAKWDVLPESSGPQRLRVRCRRCASEWHITLDERDVPPSDRRGAPPPP